MLQCRVVWVVLAGALAIAAAQTPQPNAETTRLPLPAQAASVALSASANRAAVVCHDGKLRVWDLAEARLLRVIALTKGEHQLHGHLFRRPLDLYRRPFRQCGCLK